MNLFSSLQKNLIEAVKAFLASESTNSEKNLHTEEKLVPISLRISSGVKTFFDCVADKSGQSFNGVITNVLEKAKEETLTEYNSASARIQQVFDYQINSFLQIIDEHKIDYNELPILLGWLTGKEIKESDLTDRKKWMDLMTKSVKEKACKLFDVRYNWLKDNSCSKGEYNQILWYKEIYNFVFHFIQEFYLDETITSFKVECFISNSEIVHNILSDIFPEQEDDVIVFITAERKIGDMKFTTYHQCESQNLNYWRSREYFVLLIKILLALSKSLEHNFLYPSAYLISREESLQVARHELHISTVINRRTTYPFHYLTSVAHKPQ